jgi:hypothetical protein
MASIHTPLWRSVILSNGKKAGRLEPVMRRQRPDGSWEYREWTDAEKAEQQRAGRGIAFASVALALVLIGVIGGIFIFHAPITQADIQNY